MTAPSLQAPVSAAPTVCPYCSAPILAARTDAFCGATCARIHRQTGRELVVVSDAAFDRLDAFASAIGEQPAAVLERFINRALDVAERRVGMVRS